MEMIDYSQEIENSSPLPLTITHDYDDSEKVTFNKFSNKNSIELHYNHTF